MVVDDLTAAVKAIDKLLTDGKLGPQEARQVQAAKGTLTYILAQRLLSDHLTPAPSTPKQGRDNNGKPESSGRVEQVQVPLEPELQR